MIPSLDGILDLLMEEIEIFNKKLFRGDGYAKIGEGKAPNFDAQDPGDGQTDFFITPRREKNFRFEKVWFLPRKVLVNVQA